MNINRTSIGNDTDHEAALGGQEYQQQIEQKTDYVKISRIAFTLGLGTAVGDISAQLVQKGNLVAGVGSFFTGLAITKMIKPHNLLLDSFETILMERSAPNFRQLAIAYVLGASAGICCGYSDLTPDQVVWFTAILASSIATGTMYAASCDRNQVFAGLLGSEIGVGEISACVATVCTGGIGSAMLFDQLKCGINKFNPFA